MWGGKQLRDVKCGDAIIVTSQSYPRVPHLLPNANGCTRRENSRKQLALNRLFQMNETNNSDNLDYSAPPRSFIEAIKVCFAKYADFKGRASLSEFWWFFLFVQVSSFVLTIEMGSAEIILAIAILVPYCAVGVRRVHDTNRSGVGFVIPFMVIQVSAFAVGAGFLNKSLLGVPVLICGIVILCLCATSGEKQKNKYNLPTDVGRETTS